MFAQVNPLSLIDALAIILAIVSLTITVVGFFASLKFYRDGAELQGKANRALTKIEEKTAFIQSQVSGMFDKTLDAAISKKEILSEDFEGINLQVEEAKNTIENSINEISSTGEDERRKIKELVENEMAQIKEKVSLTKETVEEFVQDEGNQLTKSDFKLLSILQQNPSGYPVNVLMTKSALEIKQFNTAMAKLSSNGSFYVKDGNFRISRVGMANLMVGEMLNLY